MIQPLSRRSTLKAGAHAAWMVPTVSVVTAAPAHATVSGQPELVLSGVMSSHGSDGPDLERPDLIVSEFTLTNIGTAPAPSVVVGFFLPAGVTAVTPSLVLPSAEFSALPVEGDAGSGWWLRATRVLPLGPGDSTLLGTPSEPLQVQLHDPVAVAPYRRWAGADFGATLQASADGAALISEFPSVPPATSTYFEGWEFSGSRTDDHLVLHGRVTNVGRKTCLGPISVQVSWAGGFDDGTRWTTMPASASGSGVSDGVLSGNGSFGQPWTYTFAVTGERATRQSFDDFYDPAADAHCDIAFDVDIVLGTPPGYVGGPDSRDVTLTVLAWDARDDQSSQVGFETITGDDTAPPPED